MVPAILIEALRRSGVSATDFVALVEEGCASKLGRFERDRAGGPIAKLLPAMSVELAEHVDGAGPHLLMEIALSGDGDTYSNVRGVDELDLPDLPRTIQAGAIGRPLIQLIGHPLLDPLACTITGCREEVGRTVAAITMQLVPLVP